ncbi:MAG: shikimate dehydrogenase [Kangiellaceae bacterium]
MPSSGVSTLNRTIPNNIVHCGVIGNPIAHSQSPDIHLSFAKQFDLDLDYQKYLVSPEELKSFIADFFGRGGRGLNVTLPFKQEVMGLAKNVSRESLLCRSVNTLYLNDNKDICGDTTDGKGLLIDLELNSFEVKNKNILIIGAGGATTSILYSLLNAGAKITLHNRTQRKIEKIKNDFSKLESNIQLYSEKEKTIFDGIITATSEFNKTLLNPVLKNINVNTFVYDLNYKQRAEQTLKFFKDNGIKNYSDGYGMLIAQAAKSFEIWHGKMPTLTGIKNY